MITESLSYLSGSRPTRTRASVMSGPFPTRSPATAEARLPQPNMRGEEGETAVPASSDVSALPEEASGRNPRPALSGADQALRSDQCTGSGGLLVLEPSSETASGKRHGSKRTLSSSSQWENGGKPPDTWSVDNGGHTTQLPLGEAGTMGLNRPADRRSVATDDPGVTRVFLHSFRAILIGSIPAPFHHAGSLLER